ncbi:amino acid ABC transporter permease [Longirhabdus pacifica]|uniref:amino acid ABC transporter permease n=1 Tax=Longirhabdus pacifica TaxID=2305227 RepID=UPI00100906C6|nr:ABC transporter permease subunit [Longirhabdus pacifica]
MKKKTTPFWRDKVVIPYLLQSIFVIFVVIFAVIIFNNTVNGLNKLNAEFGFGFLDNRAGFDLKETMIDYSGSDTYKRAIFAGFLNTVKVALIGIVLTSIIGVIAGVSRLSSNWLVAKLASIYIEVFRNTPLLVQIFIWYTAVVLQLPHIKESINIGSFIFNNRAFGIPWFSNFSATWGITMLIAILLSFICYKTLVKKQIELGKRLYPILSSVGIVILTAVALLFITGSSPFQISTPVVEDVRIVGGYSLSVEFIAILLGLTVYTSTYIAEIVRAGILGVAKGQVEAANALGLKRSAILRFVIFPQAIRIIIPPVTSQYLNLIKNSSLAVFVAYPDVVSVGNTIINQAGHAIEVILILMAVYLSINLLTSFIMNIFNRKFQLVER